ncbi:hypothetical protein IB269_28135 [Delftia sp. DLF01]|uniref:hypothetical protein n=1 Tax=Delftia sp. DLF01 TaxID=2769279 RepID=UPI0017831BD9|nr:hypothetical protein [Delftia sp. DLF01]MBD9585281.1 hypothetical protein [Delftia sp. DLF01]
MSMFASPRFLPRVMWADAASCAASGALQLVAGQPLSDVTGLPLALLQSTGWFLLGYALLAAWMAARSPVPRRLIGLVVVGNLGWAAGCVALLAFGGLRLSAWGVTWVLAQAVVVVVLAELQWTGLRRTRDVVGGARVAMS